MYARESRCKQENNLKCCMVLCGTIFCTDCFRVAVHRSGKTVGDGTLWRDRYRYGVYQYYGGFDYRRLWQSLQRKIRGAGIFLQKTLLHEEFPFHLYNEVHSHILPVRPDYLWLHHPSTMLPAYPFSFFFKISYHFSCFIN